MPVLFLNRQDVEMLLPFGECIEVMAAALSALARGEAFQPLRSAHWLPDRRGLLVAMPGGLLAGGAGDGDVVGVKVLTVFPGNAAHGEESHQGAVLLFDAERGRPLAFLDAASITAIRTAAVSALATRLLAREGAGDLALLGTGTQARTHLAAIREVRSLRRVRVWSRDAENARRFAAAESARHGRHGLTVEPAASAREAVDGADIICTVSAAVEPILAGEWIAPGAHVNAVGACTPNARELDTAAVVRARLFVDRRESALHEPGEILTPLREGAITEDHIVGEIGDLLIGKVEGRRTAAEVTLFESLGLTVEDLAAARHIYRKALEQGRGVALAL
jgi:ornithine cyclodeaminase